MANKKFSEFELKTSTSNVSHIVGYNGTENVRITPSDVLGAYLPLAGGTLTGALTGTTATFTGNVGVGTSPTNYSGYTTLTLGNDSGTGSIFDLEYQTTRTLSIYADSTGGHLNVFPAKPLIFYTTNSERMRLDASGNLGVGTSTPTAKLDVVGTATITNSGGGHNLLLTNNTAGGDFIKCVGETGDTVFELDSTGTGGEATMTMYSDGVLKNSLAANGNTYFNNIGNFGVGTSTPSQKLEINGALKFFGGTSSDFAQTGGQIDYYDTGRQFRFNAYKADSTGAEIVFNTGGTTSYGEKMRISSGGDVLIGTTTSFSLASHDPNVISSQSFGVTNGSTSSTFGLDRIHFDSANYFVLNQGAIGVKLVNGSTAWAAQSDESLKENIKPLENVLDKIKNYRCVEYNLKAEKIDKKIGFIAQDWEQDFDAIVDKDADGILSMKYTETIPVLLKAIQELSAKLEALECQCEKK